MPASERDVPQRSRTTPGQDDVPQAGGSGPSMSELLASCAAATAVSTPPADEAPGKGVREGGAVEERDAA
ncbi:hypothetical protein EOT10_32950 [Streptomyces antnestii]|uniref:Uncharacterized protein n=1 Tax=Streptomyces antnestii TaxID=2494256 RepID=A0A437P6K1_9ACTN|nr:hypothetical protein [Streptomyces sp. San01]RVU17911.1 hypothetical protein EOT10_32950 [Streptomyces sp. San01]